MAFRERYTSGPTLQFAGRTWAIKDAPLPAGPGSNRFSTTDASVDQQGRLHLGAAQHNGSWWSSEVILTERLGYGTCAFQTDSRLDILDANATFGAFTWDPYGDNSVAAGGPNREIDIEASRWGNPQDPQNAQFVVQPADVPGQNLKRLTIPDLSADTALTWFIRWASDQITYTVVRGSYVAGNYPPEALIEQWVYRGVVPPPGRETFHFNLWLNHPAPAGGQPIDVVVSDFRFTPTLQSSSSMGAGHAAVLASLSASDWQDVSEVRSGSSSVLSDGAIVRVDSHTGGSDRVHVNAGQEGQVYRAPASVVAGSLLPRATRRPLSLNDVDAVFSQETPWLGMSPRPSTDRMGSPTLPPGGD